MPARTTETSPSTTLRSRVAALLATLLVAGVVSLTPAASPEAASAAMAPTSEAVSAISMDSDRNVTCTIRTDRTLWCWGEMFTTGYLFLIDTGTLGENGKNEPQQIGTDLWLSVSVGKSNVCGIVITAPASTAGSLYCFGSNYSGQLGINSAAVRYSRVPVQLGDATDWTSVAVGYDNLCAIRANSLFCIGSNGYGQFGITLGSESYSELTQTPFAANVAGAVSMGERHTCFLTRYVSVNIPGGVAYCAGENFNGALGDGSNTNSADWVPVAGSHKFQSISTGTYFTCGIASSATTPSSNASKAFCWGNNDNGELGAGNGDPSLSPVVVGATLTFKSIAAGQSHVCGVTTSGQLYCWGSNSDGKSGVADSTIAVTAVRRVGTASNWAEVSAGDANSCARTIATSTVPSATYCWGWRQYTGNGQRTYFNTPTKLPGTNWLTIATGSGTRCGIQGVSIPGTLVCFGANYDGEVGNGTTDQQKTPFDVKPGWVWNEVAVGGAHTCGIRSTGALYCWGRNDNGQLGLNDTAQYLEPQQVGSATDWSNLSAGRSSTCAVRGGTRVFCWGANYSGQVGNGDLSGTAVLVPFEVFSAADGFTWKRVTVGSEYACALATSGSIFCWGEGGGLLGGGQLGDGTQDDRYEPVPSVPGMRFTDVSAGVSSTCGITAGGGTWCWGSNMFGALGNGNALPDIFFGFPFGNFAGTNSAYAGGSAVAVSTGVWSGCTIRRGGDLYCWGVSWAGLIPVGRDQASPIPTNAGSGYVKVVTGNLGYNFTGGCGIKADTTLWCWGYTGLNNFQNGWVDNFSTPQLVKVLYRKPVADGGAQITGRAKKNSVLTADAPDFSGTPIPSVTYQWYRCTTAAAAATSTVPRTCTKITSATGSTYTLKVAEVNKFVRLLITAKNKGGTVMILTASSAKVAN